MAIPSHRLQGIGEPGINCLAMCAWLLGDQVDIIATRARFATARGSAPAQLVGVAAKMGMMARVIRGEVEDIAAFRTPSLLQWGRGRYVVLTGCKAGGRLRIFDPALGWRTVKSAEVFERYSGLALEISRGPNFQRRTEKPALSAWSLLTIDADLVRGMGRLLLTSLLVQIYVVAGPLYARTIFDDVIPSGDASLMRALALAFMIVVLFDAGAGLLRTLAQQHLETVLGWQVTRNLFRHLLSLPLSWFQARNQSDVLQKLGAIDNLRQLLQQACSALFVDGMIAIVCLTMLLIEAPVLTLVSIPLVLAYISVRLVAVPINRRLQTRGIHAAVVENGHRMETIRAIQTIKGMAFEEAREADWMSKFADALQTKLDGTAMAAVFTAIQGGAGNIAAVVFFWIGATEVIKGNLTIGVLMAAVAYNNQFVSRTSSIFDQYIAWRMMDVHLSRIGDIALSARERGLYGESGEDEPPRPIFEVRNLEYRYNATERPVLSDVSFDVEAGEHVVFTGPSGIGKSTLMKLLCGLYEPTGGSIKLNGRPLAYWGLRTVRSAFGVVLQSDDLLAGAILDNVTFFEPTPDVAWAWQCLEDAGLRDEIEAMPLGVQTLVGDMGITLSGGQKQRLLLARVLYKRPIALILDEATSHLDVARERQILAMLRRRNITLISVAHRPEAIRAADRQIALGPPAVEPLPSRLALATSEAMPG